jgi:hypothetical protein
VKQSDTSVFGGPRHSLAAVAEHVHVRCIVLHGTLCISSSLCQVGSRCRGSAPLCLCCCVKQSDKSVSTGPRHSLAAVVKGVHVLHGILCISSSLYQVGSKCRGYELGSNGTKDSPPILQCVHARRSALHGLPCLCLLCLAVAVTADCTLLYYVNTAQPVCNHATCCTCYAMRVMQVLVGAA